MNPQENPEVMMPGYTDYPVAVEAGLQEAAAQVAAPQQVAGDPQLPETSPSQPAVE